jgi:hypothetical protein
MDVNLLHGKAFSSGTTGSLLRVKSSGKTWTAEENFNGIEVKGQEVK